MGPILAANYIVDAYNYPLSIISSLRLCLYNPLSIYFISRVKKTRQPFKSPTLIIIL